MLEILFLKDFFLKGSIFFFVLDDLWCMMSLEAIVWSHDYYSRGCFLLLLVHCCLHETFVFIYCSVHCVHLPSSSLLPYVLVSCSLSFIFHYKYMYVWLSQSYHFWRIVWLICACLYIIGFFTNPFWLLIPSLNSGDIIFSPSYSSHFWV